MPRLPRSLLVGLVAVLALRLVIAAVLPLGDDEAFYWDWSRHLAAGYVDHPPAIAFLIRAASQLTADPSLAVHGVAAVLSFVTSFGVYALAYDVLGRTDAAVWAVALFNTIPVFAGGGVLAAPDAPLGVAWVFTLLWAWRAAHRPRGYAWLAAGVWLGLALQSKYTAAVLPASVGAWLALAPAHRHWWRRWEPYAALLVALALFAPVVWWNATHHWASFAFNFERRPDWEGHGDVPTFVLLEFIYLGPLMFPALLWALVEAVLRGLRGDDRWLFLASAGVPVLAGTFLASLFGVVKGHWPAPGYITAAIVLAGLATERPWAARPALWRGAAVAVAGTTVVFTALIHAVPLLAPLLLPPRLDPTVDYYGWPEAAGEIVAAARRDARGPYFFTTDRYQVMAQFDLATGGRFPATTVVGDDQYAFWTRWTALRGEDGLFISDERYPIKVDLHDACRALEPARSIKIVRRGTVVRTLGLTWCRGFAGRPATPLPLHRH